MCSSVSQGWDPSQLCRSCCRVPPPRCFGKRGCKPLKTNDGRWKKRDKRLQVIESRAVRAHPIGEIGELSDKSGCEFSGSAAKKGVSGLEGYFMGYYTIWLAPVKRFFVPFWECGETKIRRVISQIQNPQPEELKGAGSGRPTLAWTKHARMEHPRASPFI